MINHTDKKILIFYLVDLVMSNYMLSEKSFSLSILLSITIKMFHLLRYFHQIWYQVMLSNIPCCLHVVQKQREGETVYLASYIRISHMSNLCQIFILIFEDVDKMCAFWKQDYFVNYPQVTHAKHCCRHWRGKPGFHLFYFSQLDHFTHNRALARW